MFSDNQHLLKLSSPAFGSDSFILTDLYGNEAISSPFEFNLETFSSADNIDSGKLVGKSATIEINTNNSTRIFNGIISNVTLGHQIAAGHTAYFFKIIPWFSLLQGSHNYRRFENKTVVEIFTTICKELGFNDFDTTKLTKKYQPLKYEVQFNESAFDFLSRVLAQGGIYYNFTHTAKQHKLVLIDSFDQNLQPKNISYSNAENQNVYIHDWNHTMGLATHQISSTNYNYETPTANLFTSKKLADNQPILGQANFEQFSFPGKYNDAVAGGDLLQNKIKNIITNKETIVAASNCMTIAPSFNFNLQEYPQNAENQQYLLLSVEHSAHDHAYLPNENHDTELQQRYENRFLCTKANVTAQPVAAYQPAIAYGSQSAKIDGVATGKLTADDLGRVKTTFFWQYDADLNPSTHWLRVIQPIAGAQWGMQFLPRVADEVIVRYLYGDPNQPIVVGSLSNAARLPRFNLPNEQNKNGVISRTVNGDKFHQIVFDDTKNKELMQLISGHDMNIQVKNNMSVNVANNLQHAIAGDANYTASQNYIIQAQQKINLTAAGNSIEIDTNQITVSGKKILLG